MQDLASNFEHVDLKSSALAVDFGLRSNTDKSCYKTVKIQMHNIKIRMLLQKLINHIVKLPTAYADKQYCIVSNFRKTQISNTD